MSEQGFIEVVLYIRIIMFTLDLDIRFNSKIDVWG